MRTKDARVKDFIGFGTAQIKQEDTCSLYDNPEDIPPWKGYGTEFREYFRDNYARWYIFGPIRKIFRKHILRAWLHALLTNAREEHAVLSQNKGIG